MANRFPFDSSVLKSIEKSWTTKTPKNAKKTPNIVTTGNCLFKTNISIIRENRGAVVPNRVALEIVVSWTAEKNSPKWNPRNMPAMITGFLNEEFKCPCLFTPL